MENITLDQDVEKEISKLARGWPSIIRRIKNATDCGEKSADIEIGYQEAREAFPDDIEPFKGVVDHIKDLLGRYFKVPKYKYNLSVTIGFTKPTIIHYQRKE